MRRALLAASFLLTVAGCARYWARPGGTAAELEAAKARCDTAALTRYPLLPQTTLIGPGYVAPLTTNCVPAPDGPHCVATIGQFVSPTYSTDMNQGVRFRAYQECLTAGGWLPAKDKAEAEAITRRPKVEAPRQLDGS